VCVEKSNNHQKKEFFRSTPYRYTWSNIHFHLED